MMTQYTRAPAHNNKTKNQNHEWTLRLTTQRRTQHARRVLGGARKCRGGSVARAARRGRGLACKATRMRCRRHGLLA
jgi:hypothetical protein